MDIATQAEIILRQGGFDTWTLTSAKPPATCFENGSVAGFLFVFDSGAELLSSWEARQTAVLARFSSLLRMAGPKARNINSVLLADTANGNESRLIAEIEENFALTRKIARANIRTQHDLEQALLPMRRIQSQPRVEAANFEARLRDQLLLVKPKTIEAFLGNAEPTSVAQMLEGDAS